MPGILRSFHLNRKSHAGLIVFLIVLALAGAGAALYCQLAKTYETKFIEGTFINGEHVGDMTAEEVEERIRSRVEDYQLTLHFAGGSTERLTMEDIGFAYASDNGVEKILKAQNPYLWIGGKMGQTAGYTVSEVYTFDEEKLKAALNALPEMLPENQVAPSDAYMEWGEDDRMRIVPEIDGNQIDPGPVYEAVKKAVATGAKDVDVTKLGVYSHASVRADDPALVLQVSDLNAYVDTVIKYELYDGSKKKVDKKMIRKWILQSEDNPGWFEFDSDKAQEDCRAFIVKLAKKYDYTYDHVIFRTSWEGDLEIPCETSGRVINQDAEATILYDLIERHWSGTRAPEYSLFRDADGTFGGTYVEVDIDAQHMWYYRNGEIYLDSDCVTGKASDSDRATPRGVYDIYTKERNRTLRGEINPATGRPSYESFVNFWMPFNEGIGLHDASWRSSFGGGIYYNNGSHGCVNLPYGVAQSLYEVIEVGTPVIVH